MIDAVSRTELVNHMLTHGVMTTLSRTINLMLESLINQTDISSFSFLLGWV